ncbi:MAG: hypothetical protein AAGD14_13765 [Planctomycetota bacterium]
MSSRPSARYNDPGYFYKPQKLLKYFAIVAFLMAVGIVLLIHADWSRPWKHDQLASQRWEARRLELENMVLEARTQNERAKIAQAEVKAQEAFDARREELKAIQKQLRSARGDFLGADAAFKTQKQFTLEAIYELEHAHGDEMLAQARARLSAERDKEARLKEEVLVATARRDNLIAEEKALRKELDQVVEDLRKNPEIRKLGIVQATRDKKRGFNPLRNAPLIDFLAPPVKVEQVVLENLVDNYEFATPSKVDRCGTCHIGIMRLGFEQTKWPVEALSMDPGPEKADKLERGVYEFVYSLLDSVWEKVPAKDEFKNERDKLRTLAIHHATLDMLFRGYDADDGNIGVFTKGAKKGRKAWKRWKFNEETMRWEENSKEGVSLLEYYYGLLQRIEKHWLSHPFLKDMVGSSSPHPYESVGCTTCHQGRGWSTDFGFAYHMPDRKEIDNWMTVARAEEKDKHLPEATDLTLDEAMVIGALNAFEQRAWDAAPELTAKIEDAKAIAKALNGDGGGSDNPAYVAAQGEVKALEQELTDLRASEAFKAAEERVAELRMGWVTDHETGKRWHDDLDWTHRKLHHWDWPQLPKMLVQASCLKCHKEGAFRAAEPEYADIRIGKPDPKTPDTRPTRAHFAKFNQGDDVDRTSRLFHPEKEESYVPESLERGMDNFLRFGCYGCHKIDETIYPFMEHQRDKVGPQLNDIVTKTSKSWTRKWIRNPKDYRPETRMPRFWGLSNNSEDFEYRFASGDGSTTMVSAEAWANAEIYAIVEWMYEASEKNRTFNPEAIDLSKADPKNGEKLLVGFVDKQDRSPKGCIACHNAPIVTPELRERVKDAELKAWTSPRGEKTGWGARMSRRQGPDLAGLGSKLTPEWLFAWLKNPRGYWHDTNMPDLRLTDQEALDLTAYLLSQRHTEFDKLSDVEPDTKMIRRIAEELKVGEQREPTDAALGIVSRMSEREQTLYVGKELFKHYGCFGCHTVEAYKDTAPIGAELSTWGSKLIARLAYNHVPIEKTRYDFAYAKMMNPRIYDLGTAASERPYERLQMPRFGFTKEEARDISTFLVGLVEDPIPDAAAFQPDERQQAIIDGRHLVKRYNCQSCHTIENRGGDIWPAISEEKWRPPSLLGQGIKTNPQWLFHFMKNPAFVTVEGVPNGDRVRPWHSIRMPTFHLTDDEARGFVRYFAALSSAPNDFESVEKDWLSGPDSLFERAKRLQMKDPDDAEGKRLLTFDVDNRLDETKVLFKAMACKSCHDDNADIQNAAPNFRHTRAGRLRPEWIRIWLWNPSKLQAGTAMPSFFADEKGPKTDFKDYHAGIPDDQIRALRDYIRWHYKDSD